jgi:hypothetical protein
MESIWLDGGYADSVVKASIRNLTGLIWLKKNGFMVNARRGISGVWGHRPKIRRLALTRKPFF